MAKKYIGLSNLTTFLNNLTNKFSQIGHKHKLSDITDYTVDTELSSTSTNPIQNKVINAEFDAVSEAMGALEAAIDDKADASHNHNDIYHLTYFQILFSQKSCYQFLQTFHENIFL